MSETPVVLLSRPEDQSRAFARALDLALPGRFRVVIAPVLRLVAVAGGIDLARAQGLLFTSANGVGHFVARSDARDLPALCVGAMTAEAARAAGFVATSAGGDAAALARMAIAAYRPGAGDFVHIRGRQAAGDLLGRLAAAGVPGRAAEIYEQAPCPLGAEARALLDAGKIAALALFSPRSAAALAAEIRAGGWSLGATASLALSPAADAGFDAPEPARRLIAPARTRAGMIAALGDF